MRKNISDIHPAAYFTYFLSVSAVMMFSSDPLTSAVSVLGAVFLSVYLTGFKKTLKILGFSATVLFLFAAVNPIFVHKGATPFLFVNGIPLTVEAAVYGVVNGAAFGAFIIWFRLFSRFMSSDGLLYTAGKLFPRTAVTLSSAFRFIPTFSRRAEASSDAVKTLGFGDGVAAKATVYSSVVTYALESSVDSADSMRARGYGADISPRKRTVFSRFSFRVSDGLLSGITLVLVFAEFVLRGLGGCGFEFYPRLYAVESPFTVIAEALYLLLFLLPVFFCGRRTHLRKKAVAHGFTENQ